jgi:hypothetical protein
MEVRKKIANSQGSFTIEAVLIMSAVFVAVFLLCFSFMLMYHQVLLTQAASAIAQEAAYNWTRGNTPYYRVFELATGSQSLKETITGSPDEQKIKAVFTDSEKTMVEKKLATIQKDTFVQLFRSIKKPEKTMVEVSYQNGLILREIQIQITQEMGIPLGQLKKFFTGKETVILQAKSSAVVTDPAEMIRDLDLALEYATKVDQKLDFNRFLDKVTGAAPKKK